MGVSRGKDGRREGIPQLCAVCVGRDVCWKVAMRNRDRCNILVVHGVGK